jgi:hypothetical protein
MSGLFEKKWSLGTQSTKRSVSHVSKTIKSRNAKNESKYKSKLRHKSVEKGKKVKEDAKQDKLLHKKVYAKIKSDAKTMSGNKRSKPFKIATKSTIKHKNEHGYKEYADKFGNKHVKYD